MRRGHREEIVSAVVIRSAKRTTRQWLPRQSGFTSPCPASQEPPGDRPAPAGLFDPHCGVEHAVSFARGTPALLQLK